MLTSLHIENIAVIKSLSVDLSTGFTVLTGETGAGKSILIDSIALLCGARSDRELIRTGAEFALVEGCFITDTKANELLGELDITPDEDGFYIVSRRIGSDGRSVAKINGRQIPTQKLKELSLYLVNIHGQQDTQAFRDKSTMLDFLDGFAGDEKELLKYKAEYNMLLSLKSELKRLNIDEDEKRYRTDFLRYRINEIELLNPKPDEEEQLKEKRDVLKNAEIIGQACNEAYRALYDNGDNESAAELLSRAAKQLAIAGRYVKELEAVSERLTAVRFEVEEAAMTVRDSSGENDELSTVVLDKIEERLMKLGDLRRKYGGIQEAIEAKEAMSSELEAIENNEQAVIELSGKIKESELRLKAAAEALSNARKTAGKKLSAAVMKELDELDMQKTVFEIEFEAQQPGANGTDAVCFMVSANIGEALRPLEKVASGGELSRIMLALKTVASSGAAPVMIFDEIDTGISGSTSYKIGKKLKKLSAAGGAQVLCITHSPQVASLADVHLKILKHTNDNRTETKLLCLDESGRVDELSRIMGGEASGEAIKKAAQELLNGNRAL